MSMGNRLIEAQDYQEQHGCELEEAMEATNWFETQIRRKAVREHDSAPKDVEQAETLPF